MGSVESRLEKEDLPWLGLLHGLVEIGLSVDPEGSGGGRLRETRLWVAAVRCGQRLPMVWRRRPKEQRIR